MDETTMSYASGTVHGDILVINIHVRELRDAQTSYALRDDMLRLVNDAKVDRVVVDLKNVTFMGSIGLLALLAVRRRLQAGQIVICNISDSLQTIFELCRLVGNSPSAPFQAESSVEAAVARLSNG